MKKSYKNPVARTAIVALVIVCSALSYGQTVDPNFLSPLVLRQGATVAISKASGKKVYVAGDIDFHGTTRVNQVVRLYSDGSLDLSFKADLPQRAQASVLALDVLPNENVVVLLQGEVTGAVGIFLLNKYGVQLDHEWNAEGNPTTIAALPDNTFLVGGLGIVSRFDQNLEWVSDFIRLGGQDTYAYDIDVEGSKIVISGEFDYLYDPIRMISIDRMNIARMNMDGTVDSGFNANTVAQAYGPIHGICVQPDLKVILEKRYASFNSSAISSLRLNADGSPDMQFNNNYPLNVTIDEAHFQNGKITIVNKAKIARLNLDGTLDAAFKPVTYDPARVRAFVLSDDYIVAANYPKAAYGITKISPSGVPSVTYKAELTRRGIINAMDRTAVSIYIGGDFIKVNNHFTKNVARLNLNGTVLTKFKVTFDPGVVTQVDGFSDAKALINANTLMRLKHDGTFDPAFSFTPFSGLTKVTKFIRQDDGRILIGAPSKIFRINANGTRDYSFNAAIGGLTNASYFDFDLDRATGKIIFAGTFDGQPSYATRNITRLNPDGSIDHAFTSQAPFSQYGGVQRIMFLDNLDVLIIRSYNGDRQPIKLHANGSLDNDFMNNYNPADVKYEFHEKAIRFGDRVIMGGYYFYSQSLITDAFFEDGQVDTNFSLPVSVGQFYDFYADNDRELFVLGDIAYAGTSKPLQMAKIIYDSQSTLALAGEDENSEISFYPNPAKTFIEITNTDEAFVNIYSLTGESKMKANVTSSQPQIDISNLAKGHYVIQIQKGGRSYKRHLIKD